MNVLVPSLLLFLVFVTVRNKIILRLVFIKIPRAFVSGASIVVILLLSTVVIVVLVVSTLVVVIVVLQFTVVL